MQANPPSGSVMAKLHLWLLLLLPLLQEGQLISIRSQTTMTTTTSTTPTTTTTDSVPSSTCVRHVEKILINNKSRNLGYVNAYILKLKELVKGGIISTDTYGMAVGVLESSSHGLCDVEAGWRKTRPRMKRQLAAVTFLGGLLIGPLLERITGFGSNQDIKLQKGALSSLHLHTY